MSTPELRAFWSPQTMEQAKDLVLVGNDWEKYTQAVIPHILTSRVQSLIPDHKTSFEIGCGVGRLMAEMSPLFETVMGIDISYQMLQFAKIYLQDAGVSNYMLGYTDGSSFGRVEDVDFVYSVICLQHIPELAMLKLYVRETYRILAPGGVLRFQTLRGEPSDGFKGFHGCFMRSQKDFEELIKECPFRIWESTVGDMHPDYLWITATKE